MKAKVGYLQVVQSRPAEVEYEPIVVKEFNLAALQDFRKHFDKLRRNDDIDIIPIIINSYGGQVDTLFAMLDIIQSSPKPVATIASGVAMSCGAILLAAGTKGYRFAGQHAQILIHQITTGTMGKMSDIEVDVKQTKKLSNKMWHILNKFCDKPKGFFEKLIKSRKYSDVFLSADESRKLGLIDHVATPTLI